MFKSVTITLWFSFLVFRSANACMSSDASAGGAGTTAAPTQAQTNAPTEVDTTPLTTQASTANPIAAQCKAVGADFGTGDQGSYTSSQFASKNGLLGNRDTGVPRPADGKQSYMGVALKPGESATIGSAPVSFSQDQNLLVKYYEATDGIVLKGCTNDESNCQDISNLGIKAGDKAWRSGNFPVTSGTNKVIFKAVNQGNNLGAVGLDSIGISDSAGGTNKCKGSSVA